MDICQFQNNERLPMNKLRFATGLAILLIVAFATVGLLAARREKRQRIAQRERIEDVRNLVRVHSEHSLTNTDIAALLVLAKHEGLKIASPIPKNPAMP